MSGGHRRFVGFTLIELLVVIAIIALLMGVLMPALARVKKQAKTSACLMNLRQWGVMFTMYASDNDSQLPPTQYDAYYDNQGRKIHHDWTFTLRPYYMKEPKIRVCPAAKKLACSNADCGGNPMNYQGAALLGWGKIPDPTIFSELLPGDYGSYGINGYAQYTGETGTLGTRGESKDLWKVVTVRGGANIPLFLDCIWKKGWPWDDDTPPPEADAGGGRIRKFCIDRHGGAINSVFFDGAARRISLKKLWQLKWHRSFDNRKNPYAKADADWPQWMSSFKVDYD